MKSSYINIDENYFRTLDLVFASSSQSLNYRLFDLPPALTKLVEQYHTDNIQDDNYYDRQYYEYYFRSHNFTGLFPRSFQASYIIKNTNDYLSTMKQNYSVSFDKNTFSQRYPIAVRYTNGTNIWLVERPPFQASITYKSSRSHGSSSAKEYTYSIYMPWTAMLLNINPASSYYDAYLFFNDGPINSLSEIAVPCFFPNMYQDGRLCLNQTSIMLQQYLAQTQSFDVATIYNFILNDYMSGGWNTDLGVNNFDYLKNRGSLIQKAYGIIHSGKSDDKRYKTSMGARNLNYKKFISNFLNYFSLAPSNEILEIITELKQTLSQGSNAGRFNTYQDLINRQQAEDDGQLINKVFSSKNIRNSYIDTSYFGLVHPSINSATFTENQIQLLSDNIIDFLDTQLRDKMIKLSQSIGEMNAIHLAMPKENNILFIKNLDDISFISSDQLNDSQFYLDMILESALV